MKKSIYSSNEHNIYFRIYTVLFIIMLCLISVDATYAQQGSSQKPKKFKVNGKKIKHIKRTKDVAESACNRLPNRTIDGTCNNISNLTSASWGATDIELHRDMNPDYSMPDYYNDMAGSNRVSPREISNLIVAQSDDMPSPRGLSSMVFTWGQFLDHDIGLTPEGETEYVPILLPTNEPLFTFPIPFHRSEPMEDTGINDARQQQNIITSWIDASNVYGSEQSRADWLRTFSQGKLKMSDGELLPYNTVDGELGSAIDPDAPSMAGDGSGTNTVFVAGDVRANEQPGLTSLHTLFVREHNRICDKLVDQGMNNDEQIYQKARKQVGGIIQAITYREFLPALGVDISSYSGYQPNVQSDISNIFATAAYRLGHTMVTNEIPLLENNCSAIGGGSLALLDGFFNPSVIDEYGIAAFLRGLAAQTQQQVDSRIVDNLRNFLFPSTGGGPAFGLDLASLNIQRGRDHGLPDYNSVRTHYTGLAAANFSDITSDTDLQADLEAAYGSVYDIDLWVGLLSEDQLPGSSVGMTLNAILGKQFEALRDGDFYYYRNDPAISGQQRNQIKDTRLSDVIERNSDIDKLQKNVFFADDCDHDHGHGNGHGDPKKDKPKNNGNHGHGLIQNNPTSTLSVFPNPSNGKINVNLLLENPTTEVFLIVQNLNGKELYKESISVADNRVNYDLTFSQFPSGIYFVQIQSGEKVYSEKVIFK